MRVFFVALVCAALCVPAAVVYGASGYTTQVTDVADAAEPDNLFDFNASAEFRRTLRQARISREGVDVVNNRASFVKELQYQQITQALDIKAQISLYHDLELNFYMPYTFNSDSTYSYYRGVNATNSSVTQDPSSGTALFDPIPYKTYHRGLTNMDFGIAWSPLNDQRDNTKPTLTLRFSYSVPIGAAFKPSRSDSPEDDRNLSKSANNAVDANNPAPLGDKIHRLKFEIGMAKRFKAIEPYITLNYAHAVADASAADGIVPPLVGSFNTGFELIPWDVPSQRRRVSFDLRFTGTYISAGRTYTELTDALRQLTYADDYANFTGGFHMVVQPISYLRLCAGVTFGHDTQHLLTNENAGTPGSNGEVDMNDPKQRNPRYRVQIDTPGRRFRVEDTTIFGFYVGLMLLL